MNPKFRTQLVREGVVLQSAIKVERGNFIGQQGVWDVIKKLSRGLVGTEYYNITSKQSVPSSEHL